VRQLYHRVTWTRNFSHPKAARPKPARITGSGTYTHNLQRGWVDLEPGSVDAGQGSVDFGSWDGSLEAGIGELGTGFG
jgi:hypothetical protein